jgi:hypothetical protein
MNWNLGFPESSNLLPKIIVSVFTLTTLSAVLFIFLVNRPVYDDGFNITDVHAYAQKGVTVSSVLNQKNPPGPLSFIWMAEGVRVFDGGELRAARLATLLSWVGLVIGVLVAAPFSRFPQLWYGAVLCTLVFPHSVIASATLLTEGPALLFAVLGVIAWTEAFSKPRVTLSVLMLALVGSLAIGAATVSRQYYLALVPATAVLGLLLLAHKAPKDRPTWLVALVISLMVALAPLLLLVLVWKGITSPGIAFGTSYKQYHAGMGVNCLRPFVASFCTAFYLIPLTFPAMKRLHVRFGWLAMLPATIVGIGAIPFRFQLIDIGVLRTIIATASRLPLGGDLAFGFIAALSVYNAMAFSLLLWERRSVLVESPPLIFSLLVPLFYVGEQFAVGGTIPFYDRYVLLLAPFLGLISFSLIPRLTLTRLAVLAGMYALSQEMLWRYLLTK